ncbi:hypothetical protein VTO42DRAFT_1718 [Malbranchea cinnamomea]
MERRGIIRWWYSVWYRAITAKHQHRCAIRATQTRVKLAPSMRQGCCSNQISNADGTFAQVGFSSQLSSEDSGKLVTAALYRTAKEHGKSNTAPRVSINLSDPPLFRIR